VGVVVVVVVVAVVVVVVVNVISNTPSFSDNGLVSFIHWFLLIEGTSKRL